MQNLCIWKIKYLRITLSLHQTIHFWRQTNITSISTGLKRSCISCLSAIVYVQLIYLQIFRDNIFSTSLKIITNNCIIRQSLYGSYYQHSKNIKNYYQAGFFFSLLPEINQIKVF